MSGKKVSRETVEETQQDSATTDQRASGSRAEEAARKGADKPTGRDRARKNREEEPPA